MGRMILVLFGIIAFLYGGFIFAAGSGTKFFLVWFALGAALAGMAVMSHVGLFKIVPPAIRTIAYFALMLFLLLFIVVEGMILSGFRKDVPRGMDYVIVLGAQVRSDGPSTVLRYRLDRAISYLRGNPSTKCIVSGGQGPNEPWSEADGMAEYLALNGIEKERIIKEDKAASTVQNIRNSKEIAGLSDASVGIITNDFHIYRAMRIAKREGLSKAQAIPADSGIPYLPNNLLREFMGVIKDFLVF